MNGWKKIRISDIGQVITGNTPPRKQPELYGEHTIFVKPTDMNIGERYCYEPEESYSELGYKKYERSLIPQGATCVVTIGSIGKKIIHSHKNIFINQAVNAVIPNDDFDNLFVFYLLKLNLFQLKTFDSGTASGRENVSKSSFSAIEVSIPESKVIQSKIGAILSSYDDLIENNLKRIKLLEEMAHITYEEWFVRMKYPGHETAIFDEETGLPKSWTKNKISDIGAVITGKTPSTSNEDFYGSDVPFIKTPDIAKAPYVINTEQSLSKLGADSQLNKYLPKNSLVVSCIGTAGQFGFVSEPSQTNQQINAIKFNKDSFVFYMYCFAKHLKPLLEALGSNGATMTNVNKSKFEGIDVVIPNEDLLQDFNELTKNSFESILTFQKQNKLLKEARDILLPRLMSGMIDIEQIELPEAILKQPE
jgi:type I restriction enzyme S subunit